MALAKQLIKAKKNWYPIVAPSGFNEMLLGEAPVSDLEILKNRYITVNLMTMTNDPKHQSINVTFKITNIGDGKASTEICGYETSPSAVKRLVRRDISRLDDSFVCETQDNKQIRVKVMLLTRTKTTSSILRSLRSTMINAIVTEVSKSDYESFLKDIIYHKVQGSVRDALKKIYPARGFEVKRVELVKRPGAKVLKPKKVDLKEENKRAKNSAAKEETQEE